MKHKHSLILCLLGILILGVLEQPGKIHSSDLIGIGQTGVELLDIIKSKSLKTIPEIEASGLLYLNDLNRYAVISDETQDRRPVLYLMDLHGDVEQAAAISGLDEINDMEAVCKGENSDIYITCSQSPNKKGRFSDSRKLFIRIERKGMNFHLKDRIFLYDLLLESLIHSNDPELKWIMPADSRGLDIEIEGMFFHQGAIFLGLKKPLIRNQAVILKIKNINQVLAENWIKSNAVTLWRTLNLKDRVTGVFSGISDLCLHQNRLWSPFLCKNKKRFPFKNIRVGKNGETLGL